MRKKQTVQVRSSKRVESRILKRETKKEEKEKRNSQLHIHAWMRRAERDREEGQETGDRRQETGNSKQQTANTLERGKGQRTCFINIKYQDIVVNNHKSSINN